MRLHERTTVVQRAEAEIGMAFWQIPAIKELTPLELAMVLSRMTASAIRMALRAERHPENPEKKADEA